jgi:hypothetical protein
VPSRSYRAANPLPSGSTETLAERSERAPELDQLGRGPGIELWRTGMSAAGYIATSGT